VVLSIVVSIALVGAERGGNGLSSKKSDQAIAAEPTRSHCSVIRVLKSFWELVMAFIYRYYDQPSLNAQLNARANGAPPPRGTLGSTTIELCA